MHAIFSSCFEVSLFKYKLICLPDSLLLYSLLVVLVQLIDLFLSQHRQKLLFRIDLGELLPHLVSWRRQQGTEAVY